MACWAGAGRAAGGRSNARTVLAVYCVLHHHFPPGEQRCSAVSVWRPARVTALLTMLVLVLAGLLLPAARAQASSSRLLYTDTTNLSSQQAGPAPCLFQTGCWVANLGLPNSSQLFGLELAEPGAGPRPGCQLQSGAVPGGLSPSRLSSHHLRLGPHLGRPRPLPVSRQDKPRPGAIQVGANQLADQSNNQNCDRPPPPPSGVSSPGCRTRSTSTPYLPGTFWAAWCSGSTRRTTGWRSSWAASGTRTWSTSEQHIMKAPFLTS